MQFVLGVQQSGSFRFFINVEAVSNSLPSAIAGGPYSGPTGAPIQFNGSSSVDLEGPVETFQWSFGDNTFGTGPAPAHTYTSAGTYTVTLTVTDSIGLTTTGTTTATIYPASNKMPIAYISSAYWAVRGTATQFSASGSFDPDGSIAQYKWDFAGLGTASGPTPSFTFSNTGTHLVSLTVTDNVGAKSWTSINVVVSAPPGEQQLGDPNISDWDEFNRPSLDDPSNNRGNPANTATGNNNFQLVAPVLSLPGRGMDLNLNLVYNSLVWNKSGNDMYFDIDHDWPAPGWHLGFGKAVSMGSAGCLLIEPDGSRHAFRGTVFIHRYPATPFSAPLDVQTFKGETTDGSMIEYRCEMSSSTPRAIARYPNGTVVFYNNISTDFSKPKKYLYPHLIVDKNGNRSSVWYNWEAADPRIERIVDSVGRVISFRYDTQKRLTAITAPGLKDANGNPTTHTFVRLHYTTLPLGLTGAFTGPTHVRNSSPFVLDAIFYPATGTGYFFGPDAYSSYGMLRKVTQQRGMSFSVSPSTPNEQGTITQGAVTRVQTYDYPAIPDNLASAPVFKSISETWDGGPTIATETKFFSQNDTATDQRTLIVTNPDQTKTVQISHSLNSLPDSDPNKFKNGLTKEEQRLDAGGNLIQRTVFTWEQGGANGKPRLQRTETTDERGQMLRTDYDQYGENNSVGRTREFDYSGAVFRTSINTFLSYLDNDLDLGIDPGRAPGNIFHPRLVNLVASTKIFQGLDSDHMLASYTEFKYDEYAETLKPYPADGESSLDLVVFGESRQPGGIIGILQHSNVFNPSPPAQNLNGGVGANYLTKRGNVTSITRYGDTSNAAAPASPVVEKMRYDMAGNVIAASTVCCEETSAVFDNLATQYAFPVSQTRGAADLNSLFRVTTSTSYDLSTGLRLSVTNANNRTTQTAYFLNSWRPKEIISSTGSRITYEYDDVAMKVVMTTRLSANGPIAAQITKHFNGLGQLKKEEALAANGAIDIVETLYDHFGRPSKQSRPYRSGQIPQWRETVYDTAGRIAEKKERAGVPTSSDPLNSTTKFFYNETTRPAGASTNPGQTTRTVDSWGRWRWVRLNSMGELAEVVEPDPAGGPGFVTNYSYSALGRLTRIDQSGQVRRFRYDSLGRLTHQKLAEKSATLNLAGHWDATGLPDDKWSDVFAYDQRSNMISHTDARGVRTIFSYKDGNVDDPLNRLRSVSYDLSGVPSDLIVLPAKTVTYQYRTKASVSSLIDVTQVERIQVTDVVTESYDFDTEGRVKEKKLGLNGRTKPLTIGYKYDALGRLEQLTYPEQYHDNVSNPTRKILTQLYDAASRLTNVKVNNADYASAISYTPESQISSIAVGNGTNQVTESYIYDPLTGLLQEQNVTRAGAALFTQTYGYTLLGCGANCPYTGQITSTGGSFGLKFYRYDDLSRLRRIEGGVHGVKSSSIYSVTWKQDYSYDRFGNRTSVSTFNASESTVPSDGWSGLSYDAATNRINTPGFTYDPAGNQLQNNTGQSFVYDAAGRLVQVKNQSGTTTLATYTYGASRRRLITQTGSGSSTDKTYYVWESDSVIAEYIEQPSADMPKWSKNYVYLGGRLLATEAPNGSNESVQYHHPDRLGTRLVTNNLDTSSFHQSTLPFGTALNAESTGATNRRFTSYDRSATTGLDYAINRQYDSRQGRFTQPDPLGMAAASLADPQSLNMYSYVGNDPANRVDPDGQFWGALFRFVAGLFRNLRPNVISGSFTYRNTPPILVAFTPNFQNIGVGFAGIGFDLRSGGYWLPSLLGLGETVDPQNPTSSFDSLGPPPPVPRRPAVNQGINAASQALSGNTLCRALFRGTHALNLLNTYVSNGLINSGSNYQVMRRGGRLETRGFQSGDIGAVTSYAAGSFLNSAGIRISASPITINNNGFFFSGRNTSGVLINSILNAGFYELSLSQLRGAVIIHELLHVAGRIPSDLNDSEQSRNNSDLVRQFCFPPEPLLSTASVPLAQLP